MLLTPCDVVFCNDGVVVGGVSDERCLVEVASLRDDLTRRHRFGFVSITTRRGHTLRSASLASSSYAANVVDFGLDGPAMCGE